MATIQIKVIESGYSETLEEQVNEFLDALKYDPIKITFGNSFSWEYDDSFTLYTPTYTAIIEYRAVPDNVDAVAAYNETH